MAWAITIVVIILASQLLSAVFLWMQQGTIRRLTQQNELLHKRLWLKKVVEGPGGLQATAVLAEAEQAIPADPFARNPWDDSLPDLAAAK